jgi:GNAT superfamily N-acetyltransferase
MLTNAEFCVLRRDAHDVRSFDAGDNDQTVYLRQFALRNMQLRLNRSFVLPCRLPSDDKSQKRGKKDQIAAYYTLANLSVRDLPSADRLPRYPIPVILLARLAVACRYQGQGLGTRVLVHALRHAARVATADEALPARGVVLGVADEAAARFYAQFDFFEPFPDDSRRLFVSLSSIQDHLL